MKPPADPTKIRVVFDISNVRAKDARLYQEVIASLGSEALTGEVSLTRKQWLAIPDAVRDRLMGYLYTINSNPNAHIKQVDEPASQETSPRPGASENKAAAEKSLQAALARLQDYFQAGLVDSPENVAIFDRTWREHPQLSKVTQSSPEILDAVIAICRDKLAWRKPTRVVTPQPEEPVILSDGKPQLPIDTVLSNRYTVVQLRDLDRRRRARDAGESESLPPLPSGKLRLPFGTKPNPAKHSADQIRDLESRTARVWARQTGSHGASWFSSDSQVI